MSSSVDRRFGGRADSHSGGGVIDGSLLSVHGREARLFALRNTQHALMQFALAIQEIHEVFAARFRDHGTVLVCVPSRARAAQVTGSATLRPSRSRTSACRRFQRVPRVSMGSPSRSGSQCISVEPV